MGHPTITRLGKTQFWYKNWSNTKLYSKNLKIFNTFENLTKLYFDYGLAFKTKIFNHYFWYTKTNNALTTPNYVKYRSYFRKYFYSHKTLTIDHSYYLRLRTPEYFPLRVYALKYKNWLLISLKWLKPLKNSRLRGKRNTYTQPSIYSRDKTQSPSNRTRLLFFHLIQLSLINTTFPYKYNF